MGAKSTTTSNHPSKLTLHLLVLTSTMLVTLSILGQRLRLRDSSRSHYMSLVSSVSPIEGTQFRQFVDYGKPVRRFRFVNFVASITRNQFRFLSSVSSVSSALFHFVSPNTESLYACVPAECSVYSAHAVRTTSSACMRSPCAICVDSDQR